MMPGAERRVGAALALSALLAACGAIDRKVAYPAGPAATAAPTPAAPPSAANVGGRWDSSLAGLQVDNQRVADIAYRLALANVDLCQDRAPLTGLVLHSTLLYSPGLRAQVAAAFHIDDRAAVRAVAAGSPAAEAGLRPGDILLAVDSQPLPRAESAAGEDRPQTYAPVGQAVAAIAAALATGPAELTVERDGQPLTLTLNRREGCAYQAQVLPGAGLKASADGRWVTISSGLVSWASSNDALAQILGHEYAHDVLRHHDRLDRASPARAAIGNLGASPASLIVAEKEADYVGLYLTARAGYDISAAPDLIRRFPSDAGDFDWSHPGIEDRARLLAATRDEIARKRASGEPLTPNPATQPSR